ncbi:DUF6090 family protein [Psychroserpens algicola]|uniref:DUF6090 family protein n=1 Tax=Psychroserpens algicola TaxID=1719034 RepID=A0ABT0HDZ3_9FLAO|nr:DUF6090 family protein [Psychroserpens algicola]MCK8482274.1 DUF6090 family protein [Psychroserpens algicola]
MLSEGKTGKYFKYAIGEIILVVIGILIALQINNWNEERKVNKERTQLLKSIKADLETDVEEITSFLTQTKEGQKYLQDASQKISSTSFPLDSLIHFVKDELFIYVDAFNGFNNNTYNSAKSSGKVEIIEDDIKRALFDLSIMQERIARDDSKFYDVHLDEFLDFNGAYPLNTPFTFVKSGSVKNLMWSDINKKDLALKLNDWGTSKYNLYRMRIPDFENVLEQTKAVLVLIEHNQ